MYRFLNLLNCYFRIFEDKSKNVKFVFIYRFVRCSVRNVFKKNNNYLRKEINIDTFTGDL